MAWERLILESGGLMSPTELEELEHAARHAPEGVALEVGHYTGCSTVVLLESLPLAMRFVTIDSHRWRDGTLTQFHAITEPHIALDRECVLKVAPFEDVLGIEVGGPFSFIFYDGPHDENTVARFWSRVRPQLAAACVLAYDDADWPGMAVLERAAKAAGFIDITPRPIHRHVHDIQLGAGRQHDLDLAKRHPDSYTLRIMRRSGE